MADTTTFSLEVSGVTEADADAICRFLEMADAAPESLKQAMRGGYPLSGDYGYDPDEGCASFGALDEVRWSASGDVLREVSGYYPQALFVLESGGHPEDLVRAYFRGGLFYEVGAEVRFPEFDERLLG